jgi:hypothetical protein
VCSSERHSWFSARDERSNLNPVSRIPYPLQGVEYEIETAAEEKPWLQPSHDVVDGQQENIEDLSTRRKEHQTPPDRVNPAVDAHVRKDLLGLLKHGYRPART